MSPPQQDMSKMQTCVLKVNVHCQGCKRKVKKILNKVQGVCGVDVDAERGRATVTGVADPDTLINKLAKAVKPAELLETPKDGQQKKNVLLPSSDKSQIVNTKIIQPGDNTNKVSIPKGMKVVKEVKVLADNQDDDELKVGDGFTSLGAKDGGGSDRNVDGIKVVKGKGSEAGVGFGKSRKKGTQQHGKKGAGQMENTERLSRLEGVLKNKFTHAKANSNTGGGIGNFGNGQGVGGAKAAQMDPMAQLSPMQQFPVSSGGYYQGSLPYDNKHHIDAVVLNHPQQPMAHSSMYHKPMKYSQPDSNGRLPLSPPRPTADPLSHIFSDENANGCRVM